MPTLNALNNAPPTHFLTMIGGPLEGQTWLAERVAPLRPFVSVEALIEAFEQIIQPCSAAEKIALIASHPDLGSKLAIGLSDLSVQEQAAAGLDRLMPEEYAQFHSYNTAYKQQFGFPFVICARDHTKDSILAAFVTRLQHTRPQEINSGIAQVQRILALRLRDHFGENA